jgi:CubicO group peptidase (beta-lactamase class C family)
MELPVALSASIRMRIYSITKHFTCLAYLLLCEEGRAGIDDPVGRYFPEFHASARAVTLRQLMGNIGGLRDVFALSFQFCGTNWFAPSDDIIALYRSIDDVEAPPGSTWIYNSAGYILLGHVIERISGQSLGDFLRERIFRPIGMYDTLLRRTDSDFVPNSATMHTRLSSGAFSKLNIGGDRAGSSGVVSTVNDMLRWLAHMSAPVIGSAHTWALMKTPQVLANGTPTAYGFGLASDLYRGVETLYHSGSGMGANAQILKVPAAGLDVVVMSNRGDVSSRELTLRILDRCLTNLTPAVGQLHDGAAISGTFRSEATGRVVRLFSRAGQQFASGGGFAELPMIRDGDVLRPSQSGVLPFKYHLELLGSDTDPVGLKLNDYGNLDELRFMAPLHEISPRTIAGRYRSASTGFEAVIADGSMRTVGAFGSMQFELECLAKDTWYATPCDGGTPFLAAFLTFNDAGFELRSQSTRSLSLRRCG